MKGLGWALRERERDLGLYLVWKAGIAQDDQIFGMGRRETFRGGRRGLEFSRMPRVITIIPRERQRGVEFCRSAVNNFSRMAA